MKTYIWTRSWTIRASKSIFYVSSNCYSLFTKSRQRLEISFERNDVAHVMCYNSPQSQTKTFLGRISTEIWSAFVVVLDKIWNKTQQMYTFSVLLSCFIYKTLFLKNFVFSLDFPFNEKNIFFFIYFFSFDLVRWPTSYERAQCTILHR